MTVQEEAQLSFYEKIAVINEEHKVWLVQHIESKQIYIWKELYIYAKNVFAQLKKIENIHIPKIIECIQTEECLIVIEEYISGMTLQNRIDEQGVFSIDEALHRMLEICDGIETLHALSPSVIHRDLKPSNIMITNDGVLKIIDFNAAKQVNPMKNQDTVLIGSKDYAAPEQFGFGQSDTRTDIYGMGGLLQFMVTGQLKKEKPMSGWIGNIIDTCTQLEPAMRYQSINELRDAIMQVLRAQAAYQQDKQKKTQQNTSHEEAKEEKGRKRSGIYPYCSYLPPGFRSGHPVKMVAGIIGYMLLTYLVIGLEIHNKGGTVIYGAERLLYQIVVAVAFIFIILFCANYRGVRKRFPGMNHKSVILRYILGFVWCYTTLFVMILAAVLVAMLTGIIQ